jgi:two-component system, LuxR family, response regulator FixJ
MGTAFEMVPKILAEKEVSSFPMFKQQKHVFVIDDDQASRESIVALVAPLNLEVQAFERAEDFLRFYSGQRPACVISDQRMAGMSGIQLLEKLRQQSIQIAVVIITAFPDTRSTVAAMKFGAVTLLEKPCNPQELWDTILHALELDEKCMEEEVPRSEAEVLIQNLSTVELDVLRYISKGLPNKVIAKRVGVSLRTIEARRASILSKLGVQSIAEAVVIWTESGQE